MPLLRAALTSLATLFFFATVASANPDFTWSPAAPVAGSPVQFAGICPGGCIPEEWKWSIAGSVISTSQNHIYTFAAAGAYAVKLEVRFGATWYPVTKTLNVSPAAAPGGPFHGTWSGTAHITCTANTGQTFSTHTSTTWSISQNGSVLSGTVNVPQATVEDECTKTLNLILPLSASANGNSFSGTVTSPEGEALAISGSVSGSSLSAALDTDGTDIMFTATRASSAPRGGLVGTWSGTYNDTISSTQCGSVSSSGPMVLTLFQEGEAVTASGSLVNIRRPCSNDLETEQFATALHLSGNRLSGTEVISDPSGGEYRTVIEATVSGGTITGTARYSGPVDQGTTTFTLTNSSALPLVQSFTATPEVVPAGQSVTLAWTTLNSSSVSIDHGAGSQPAAGSLRVTPTTTTTYTLTATNASGATTSSSITVTVNSAALVSVSSRPNGLLQLPGTSGATDRYVVENNGGTATTVTLSQDGDFFSQSPVQFTLAPGASQEVTIVAKERPAGAYSGTSTVAGTGVPPGLTIAIKLLVDTAPSGTTNVVPANNRVDTVGAAASLLTGTASFTNSGTSAVDAIVVSDQPWLIPQAAPLNIPPGGEAQATFTIDPALRSDAANPIGSLFANLTLRYLAGQGTSGAARALNGSSTTSTSVTVIHTVAPVSSLAEPPPLSPGEIAIFLAGMGHVTGSVGVFLSDLTLLNRASSGTVSDLRLFFSPISGGAGLTALVPSLAGNEPLALADVVKSVFKYESHNGSMQIRTKDIDKISVSANVFNSSDPKGTYGTVIPPFRSDRAVSPGGSVYLTGLRADATSHTNLYIQETSGSPVTVRVEFRDASGAAVGAPQMHTIGAFKLIQLGRVVPDGAVSSIVTSDASSTGRFLAYATPVDRASGDTWAVADWARLGGFSNSEPVVIPVAGAAPGANNTYFRTDLAIMNSGTTTASGTLTYYGRSGERVERAVSIAAGSTTVLDDVVTTFFNVPAPTVGFILLVPDKGAFVLNSRTYTTVSGSAATFGTSIAAIPVASSLRLGQIRQFGGIEDSALGTIQSARPGTFRTNFGILETSGETVTVRVTARYVHATGASRTAAVAAASKEYTLAPRQFLQLSRVTHELIGPSRDVSLGDLRGVRVDFQVVSGTGSVVVFTSSVDNGTGDSTTRTE